MSVYTDSYDLGLRDAIEGRERSDRRADLGFDARGYRHGFEDGIERRRLAETPAMVGVYVDALEREQQAGDWEPAEGLVPRCPVRSGIDPTAQCELLEGHAAYHQYSAPAVIR